MGQRRNKRRRHSRRRSARKDFAHHYAQGGYQRSLFHELLEERRLLATDWELLGPEIDGTAAGDWSGNATSLSNDGRTLVVGAPKNDTGGANSGHTRVYQYLGGDNNWEPLGQPIVGESGDEAGTSVSVSMDGQRVAIGAPLNNGARGTDSGTVRVYDYDSIPKTWMQRGEDVDGEASGDRAGTSVSLSADGNTLAIGAPLNNGAQGADSGHTRIHRYDSISNTWLKIGQDLDGEAAGDEAGTMVSLSDDGNTVAIGAPKNNGGGFNSGHVRVYQYNSGTDQWIQLGLDINGEAFIDMSGAAVSLSGDGSTVASGAILNTGGGTAAGHARAFRYTAGAWKQLGPDINGENAGDASGSSVALDLNGNRIAVGAWGNDGANGENSGHVRVFEYRGADNSWIPVGTDIDGEAIGDESGSSVAFSNDGNTISIGAISNLGNGNVTDGGSGHTRVYHFADPNNANAPPTLNAIANISIAEDASEQTVNLAGISAGTDETQLLRVTATSNNTNLVPDPDVDYASANATGTLTFTPVANQHGTATITVTVEDAGPDGNFDEADDNATVTRTFDVVVTAVNDVPTLDAIINISIAEDASEQTVNLAGISAGGSESQPLRVTVSSSNTDLIPDPTVTYASANATGNIAFTPVADQSGTATITVTVEDGGFDNDLDTSEGNATFSRSFDVIVNSINDDPTLEAVILEEIVQVGSDIDGEAAGDYSGSAVSISGDGTTVAIGAHENDGNDGNGDNSGHVRIFHLDETGWSQIGSDIDGETNSEQFSKSVAINNDGTIVAIGSPSAKYPVGTNLTGIGKVGVFQFNGTDWNQIGSDIYGEAKDDRSGAAISLSSDGKTLAIGAPLNGGNRGHVRIYRFDGSNWNQFGNDIDGKAADHQSGTSVSLSSNGLTVAIGSPTSGAGDFHGGATNLIGYVRVYSYNSSGSSWDLVGSDINGLKWRDGTGQSVSLSGDGRAVAVSSIHFTVSGSGESAGQVRIFQLSGGNWQQIGDDINGLPGDRSGSSLSLTADGRTVAIGSPYHNHDGSNNTGTSRIYRFDGTQWNQVAEDLVGESGGDYSGNVISISSDGSMVAVGAYLNDGNGGNAGHVRVHRIHDPNKVQENEYQEDADTQTINLYGISAGPNETQPLQVTASSSNASLIPNPTVTYTTPEATGTLQFTPVPDQYGSTTITVTVEDGGLDNDLDKTADNATFSRSFDIIVTPVNDAPVITVLGEISLTVEGLRGGEYNDAGASAWDAEDGNLTNDMAVSGDLVNLGKRDTYIVRYDVQDSAEIAAAQQIRTVTIVDTLPPVTTLRLDNQVIHISDHTQIGVGGVTNTDPGQPQLTNNTSVGNATKLTNPIYRDTRFKQPDGSDVGSRQDWTGRAAAGAAPDPELPTAAAWDRLETPIAVTSTFQRIDLDGTACTENCTVTEVDFSQRSTYLLEYDAHDQTGNHAEQVVFALILDDQTAPVITVAGGPAELVELSSNWTLAESTAVDNIDGSLTANIRYRVENSTTNTVLGTDLTYAAAAELLHTNEVANYSVTMTVSDSAGIYGKDNANNTNMAIKVISIQHTVNALPTLNEIPKQTVVEDSLEQSVVLGGITPGGIEVQPLRVTASSSKPQLIEDPTVVYTSAENSGTLKFTPVSDQHGTATITVTVEDGGLDNNLDTLEGNGTFSRTFQVDVTPVNDVPVITVLGETSLAIEGLRGGNYSDAGASAWDVEDGDLTNDVSVSGDLVNLGKRDTYIVRYDVQDSAELAAAQQIRTVTIVDTLPPVTTLRLDNQVIHVSDHTQIGVGGVTNTDPGQPQLTNNTSVGNATKLANPVYRDTRFKQPDGSDVGSRQDWTGRAAAGAVPDPELPTASAWDRLETPITVTSTFNRIDLDGTACTENCTVAEVDFSQRSTYLLEYDAHDQTGNHAEQVVFALILDDQTTPVITIAGGDAATVEFGSDWTLAESTAVDNIDGNLTADIRYQVDNVTAGTVLGTDLTFTAATNLLSTSVVAEYLVTMTVSDHAGIYGKDNANNRAVAHKAIAVRHTVNVSPTLDNIPKQTVVEDSLEQTIALGGVTPGGIEVQQLRVTASSSKPELIEDPTVVYTSAETTGELKFTPRADQDGTATITVTVEDGGLDNNLDTLEGNGTFSRTFDVSVTPVNDLPIAGDVTYRPLDNTRLNKDQVAGLATLVTDVDKDGLAFSVVAGPSDGQLVLNEDGSFHYTPDSNFNLTDSFSYLAHDGTADSNVGTVTLQVDTDYSWYNCREPRDVNADSLVTPLDVLWVINTINNQGSHPLAKIRTAGIVKPFLDVNRDAHATPLDALWVINYLNQRSFGEGEAASETPAAALAIDRLMSEQAMRRERLERASRAVTAVTGSVSQPVLDNTPYWQRVDETFDSIMRPARRSQLSDADSDRDELFEQSDWLDFLGEDEAF